MDLKTVPSITWLIKCRSVLDETVSLYHSIEERQLTVLSILNHPMKPDSDICHRFLGLHDLITPF